MSLTPPPPVLYTELYSDESGAVWRWNWDTSRYEPQSPSVAAVLTGVQPAGDDVLVYLTWMWSLFAANPDANLAVMMGSQMGPVLARLVQTETERQRADEAESEVARLRAVLSEMVDGA
jgi:hypothetical protein